MLVGLIGDRMTYATHYCYENQQKAEAGLRAWNGEGDPEGWHRHAETGRRRLDGDPTKEYIAW